MFLPRTHPQGCLLWLSSLHVKSRITLLCLLRSLGRALVLHPCEHLGTLPEQRPLQPPLVLEEHAVPGAQQQDGPKPFSWANLMWHGRATPDISSSPRSNIKQSLATGAAPQGAALPRTASNGSPSHQPLDEHGNDGAGAGGRIAAVRWDASGGDARPMLHPNAADRPSVMDSARLGPSAFALGGGSRRNGGSSGSLGAQDIAAAAAAAAGFAHADEEHSNLSASLGGGPHAAAGGSGRARSKSTLLMPSVRSASSVKSLRIQPSSPGAAAPHAADGSGASSRPTTPTAGASVPFQQQQQQQQQGTPRQGQQAHQYRPSDDAAASPPSPSMRSFSKSANRVVPQPAVVPPLGGLATATQMRSGPDLSDHGALRAAPSSGSGAAPGEQSSALSVAPGAAGGEMSTTPRRMAVGARLAPLAASSASSSSPRAAAAVMVQDSSGRGVALGDGGAASHTE